jgi:hypothetical protein
MRLRLQVAGIKEDGMTTAQDILARVRAEYLEMPGMTLTTQQVQRLCGIDPTLCQKVLDAMVEAQFLCVKQGGRYARVTDGSVPRLRSAKAHLVADTRIGAAS